MKKFEEEDTYEIGINDWYTEFDFKSLTIVLDAGEKIKIQVLDANDEPLAEKIFTAKYLKNVCAVRWQDKGVKSEESLYETIRVLKTP